jgi:hypothetical protein
MNACDEFRAENIPLRLRAMRRWVLVRHEYCKDPATGELVLRERWISFHTGRECGPGNPRDWATFEEVHGAWQRWPDLFDGLAVALGWELSPDANADVGTP